MAKKNRSWRDIGSGRVRSRIKNGLIDSLGGEEGTRAFEQGSRYFKEREQQSLSVNNLSTEQQRLRVQVLQGQQTQSVLPTQAGQTNQSNQVRTVQSPTNAALGSMSRVNVPTVKTPETKLGGSFVDAKINPYSKDFDWTKMTVDQKAVIAKDPNFKMSKVVAPGQQGLILSDKEAGLWSNTADQQWWQPVAYSLLSDPKSTPLIQSAAMIGMGAAAGGGAGAGAAAALAVPMTALAYGAQMKGDTNPVRNAIGSFSEFLLKPFMWGAQTLEQVGGVVDYLTRAKTNEVTAGEVVAGPLMGGVHDLYQTYKNVDAERLNEFISDPQLRSAVWDAGKVYYDQLGSTEQAYSTGLKKLISYMPESQQQDTIKAINAVLPLIKDENQVWVLGENEPVPVRAGYTLDDAVQRVLKGESADVVMGDYQREYGISGVASDFLLSSIYDPLNVAPMVVGNTHAQITKAIGTSAENKARKLTNLGALNAADTAKVERLNARAGIEKLKTEIYQTAPGMTGMAVPWNEASKKFKEIIKTKPDLYKELNWGERFVAGINPEGKVTELMPNAPKTGIPKFLQMVVTLQPEAKANLFRDKLQENMNVLFNWAITEGKTDPKALIDVVEAASKMDMRTLRDTGADFMGSPEAYTTIGAARDVLPKLRKDQVEYEALAGNRKTFLDVTRAIGDDPKAILKEFLKDDPRPIFDRLKEKLGTSSTPEAKAMLKAIDQGELTAGGLKQTFKALENAPISDIEFMAQINERMYDHLKDWGKGYFEVKDHNKWDEALRLLKGAQSLMLLDVNPQSILNDFINERVMLMAGGTLGLTREATINTFKQDFGVWPEAAGGSGLLGDVATEKQKLSSVMKENKSAIGKAADKLNALRSKLPRSKASGWFNKRHHDQLIYTGAKEYWGRNWVEGKGFDRMPASLEARLKEYGIDPQLVYRNARSVLKPEQLELLKTRVTNHDLGNYVADAAEKAGKTPGELTSLLEKIGVLDDLRTGLEKADTPQKRQDAFDQVEQKVQDYIDKRILEEIPGKIQDYIDKIKTEGAGGAMQIFHEVSMQSMETRIANDSIWDEAYAKADKVGWGAAQQIKQEAARQASMLWRRTQTRQACLYTAAAEALGFRDEFRVSYLTSLGEQHGLLKEYFAIKNREWTIFFNTIWDNPAARSREYYALVESQNKRFAEANSKVLKIQQGMNELFIEEMRVKYGEPTGVMANEWVSRVYEASSGIHDQIVSFRDSIKFFDPDQRAEAWKQFKPEFQSAYRERTKVDMEGAAKLWKGEERETTPEPTVPVESMVQPVEGPQVQVGPKAWMGRAESRMRKEARPEYKEKVRPLWDVAEVYSLAEGKPFNRLTDNANLLTTLRKEEYGGIPGLELTDERVTPEFVKNVLDERNFIAEADAIAGLMETGDFPPDLLVGHPFLGPAFDPNVKEYPMSNIQITKGEGLSPRQRIVEARFAEAINNNLDGMIEEYWQARAAKPGERNVVNVDLVRELSPDFMRNKIDYSSAVHRPASALQYEIGIRKLAEPLSLSKKENYAAVIGGAPGSGKSSAVQSIPELYKKLEGAHVVFDMTLSQLTDLQDIYSKVLDHPTSPRRLMPIFVARDPLDSLGSIVIRAQEEGRTLPLKIWADSHMDAPETNTIGLKGVAGDPRVDPHVVNNMLGKNKAVEIPAAEQQAFMQKLTDDLKKLYNKDSLIEAGLAELDKGVNDGHIQQRIYNAIAGHDARRSGGVLSGSDLHESLPGGAGELRQPSIQGTGKAGNGGADGGVAQPAVIQDITTKPRSQIHPFLSETLGREAHRIADVITGSEPGSRQFANGKFIGATGSTYPGWYNDLQKQTGGKKKLLAALEKIQKDHGADKGAVVERVKEFLASNLTFGDLETGSPPNLSVLKLLGADTETLLNTLQDLNDEFHTSYTLDEILNMEGFYRSADISEDIETRSPDPRRLPSPEGSKPEQIIQERMGGLEEQYSRVLKEGMERANPAAYLKQLREIQDNLRQMGQAVPEDAPSDILARLILGESNVTRRLDAVKEYLSAQETIKAAGAQTPEAIPGERIFQEGEQAGPRALFKDGGDLPLLPPGGYDQLANRMDTSKLFEDGWSDQIRPALEAMKNSANSPERRYTFEKLDSQTQKDLNQYLSTLNSKMANTKHASLKWGEVNAEYGLLNYDRQYGFDKLLGALSPYEFFGTRTAMNWIARVMDRPAFISQYMRFMNLRKTYESELPERLRGKMWIPMPFMPEWAGGGMWIDPTNQLIPFKPFLQPLTAYKRDQQNLINNTMYTLRDMENDPSINRADLINAMDTQSGPLWERAMMQTKADQGENATTGIDYLSMLISPALYMSIPYYLATGKKLGGINSSWPSGQLPITRVGSALEAAFKGTSLEWIGNTASLMAAPERAVRKNLNLNEFGEWGEYYVERQLVNMAAEDGVDVKQIHQALIEKSGPLYEEATNRVRYELMLKVPGMAPLYTAFHGASLDKIVGSLLGSLLPGGLLPPAEMEYKGLKQEYNLAWEAKNNGNDEPMSQFFDDHPEYSVRLALRRDPEERLQQFLKSEVWDSYYLLGKTNQKQVTSELGPEFSAFFDSEPGVEYSNEQLVQWVRALKGAVPKTEVTAPILAQPEPQIDYLDESMTRVTDLFFTQRTKQFPDFYETQQGYYALASKGEKARYLADNPDLKAYWDWKDRWYKAYPEYKSIFKGDAFKQMDTSGWPPMLEDYVRVYALTGGKIPSGANKALQQVWISEGMPMGDYKQWVDSQVVPGMLYGQ